MGDPGDPGRKGHCAAPSAGRTLTTRTGGAHGHEACLGAGHQGLRLPRQALWIQRLGIVGFRASRDPSHTGSAVSGCSRLSSCPQGHTSTPIRPSDAKRSRVVHAVWRVDARRRSGLAVGGWRCRADGCWGPRRSTARSWRSSRERPTESAQAGHAPPAPFLPGLCGALASLAPRRIACRFLQPSGWAQGGAPYRPPCAAGRRGGVLGRRGRGRRPGARPRVDVLPVRAESGNPAVAPRPHGIETPAGDPREAAGSSPAAAARAVDGCPIRVAERRWGSWSSTRRAAGGHRSTARRDGSSKACGRPAVPPSSS